MREISRQFIHLSGVLFILLAQFTGGILASLYFFMIGLTFFLYSLYILREENRFKRIVDFLDRRIRGKVMRFEREGIPFQGAAWFYVSCGVAFLIFPLHIATTACLILAISDALATLVGHRFGRKKILGSKTLEGTLTFFLSSLLIAWILFPAGALVAAVAATAGELLPELSPRLKKRGILDDNLFIPLFAGVALLTV